VGIDQVTHQVDLIRKGGGPHGESPPGPRIPARRQPINTTSWRIVTILALVSAIAAGLMFATGLKANADGPPPYGGRSTCEGAFAHQSGCDTWRR